MKRMLFLAILPLMVVTMLHSSTDSTALAALHTQGMNFPGIVRLRLHHGQDRFLNPFAASEFQRRNLIDIIKWRLFTDNPYRQEYALEKVEPVHVDWQYVKNHNSVSLTWINHASLLIRENGTSLIIDPVFSGLFWPIKDFSPLAFSPGELPDVEAVLITHGHYDHLDLDSLRPFNASARIITPLGYADLLKENGAQKVQELDWLDRTTVGPFEITLLPCNHWTMRNPVIGPNTALWGSYLIRTSSGKTIYISGDTAYFDRFGEIGGMYRIDLAVFNLGAYEPRWFMDRSHINPEQTVRAFRELGAERLMTIHWGTFRLGDEPVYRPPMDIRSEMDKAGLADRLIELRHGQTLFLE